MALNENIWQAGIAAEKILTQWLTVKLLTRAINYNLIKQQANRSAKQQARRPDQTRPTGQIRADQPGCLPNTTDTNSGIKESTVVVTTTERPTNSNQQSSDQSHQLANHKCCCYCCTVVWKSGIDTVTYFKINMFSNVSGKRCNW